MSRIAHEYPDEPWRWTPQPVRAPQTPRCGREQLTTHNGTTFSMGPCLQVRGHLGPCVTPRFGLDR